MKDKEVEEGTEKEEVWKEKEQQDVEEEEKEVEAVGVGQNSHQIQAISPDHHMRDNSMQLDCQKDLLEICQSQDQASWRQASWKPVVME